MSKLKVAVVYGGRSGEHEVSLRSAESIISNLDPERYEVSRFLVTKDGAWNPGPILPAPGANPNIDLVFPIVHGTFGEDGTMQGLFELADLPYVGPGVLGSATAMDKEFTKRILHDAGVPIVDYVIQRRGELDAAAIIAKLGLPVFVKPANLGSSVGINKAKNLAGLEAALEEAASFDTKVIIERAVAGREFECSVLGNEEMQASFPCEILPAGEFYDYDAKYVLDTTRIELPAKLDAAQTAAIRKHAVDAVRALGCEGMSRVDFLYETATGQFYVNEVNTLPGFTSISMYPKMWEHSGIPYARLLDRLIELALERHARKAATRFYR
ncbi:D-alanine--D-alanine ligase family protein [Bryobacter aggregatus]|uniref:D-alanine--D-alanine ligase family protein n=1 Tax=Bryobacter aggregatus TaxID=360054 RepID=UPI0004E168AE|nr:D-alanine--D-alanine ligase family protein [Bryobacter aggregatus]